MKQKLPDICDLCAKDIDSEMQYVFDVTQGKSNWFNSAGIKIVAKGVIDCCHACFLNICKNGYKPKWVKEQKNPQWVPGSKKGSGTEYSIQSPIDEQKPLEIPSTGAV